MSAYWSPLLGGMTIGLSAVLLLAVNGRIAGISGIVGGLLRGSRVAENAAFALGLIAGPFLYRAAAGDWPAVTTIGALPAVAVAGLLVGVGTRMGSGCTSGHGILGLARFSPRSMAATATFLAVGMATATVAGLWR